MKFGFDFRNEQRRIEIQMADLERHQERQIANRWRVALAEYLERLS
jgi:hypothetical protein